jgi:flagellar hook-associated protein FlgK
MPNPDARVTGTVSFPDADNPILPALTEGVNNTLVLEVNNGNGDVVGPFTVNFETGSSPREIVERINQTFKNVGGQGTIASLDQNNRLVLDTTHVNNSVNNPANEIDIDGASTALGNLGLVAGSTFGTVSEDIVLLDVKGVHYRFEAETNDSTVGSTPSRLKLVDLETEVETGTYKPTTGTIASLIDASDRLIPEMRAEISDFAVSIKESVNRVLNLGQTAGGTAGDDLFIGTHAGNFDVNPLLTDNSSTLATGLTGAAGDGSVAKEIAELFFDDQAVVSGTKQAEKVYLQSNTAVPTRSNLAIVPNDDLTVTFSGLISNNGTTMNAGGNNGIVPGQSLVQVQFQDEAGVAVGAPIQITGAEPPNDFVSVNIPPGAIPPGAAFLTFEMNPAFDADFTDNEGHFGISVYQNFAGVSESLNSKMASVVGEFGQIANTHRQNLSSSRNLTDAIDGQRQAVSGVSLEEEAANLIMYQNAFSANARVFNTINQMFDDLLNMI